MPAERRFRRRLLLICTLGLALRLGVVIAIPTQPVSDFWSYHRRAANLLDLGTYGVRAGRPDATWPPGYPLVLAGALAVGGRRLIAVKLLNVGLGVAIVALAGFLGRRLFGERAGLVSAGIAAVLPRLVLLPCILASENLFTPLLLLWTLSLAASWRRPGADARSALAGGAVLGALALTRSVAYPLGLLWPLAALAARKRWRGAVAETLLVLLAQHAVMLPWALRNQAVLGSFSFLTNAAGMTLFIGNNPHATGSFYDAREDFAPVARGLSRGLAAGFERDRAFGRAARVWIRENPSQAFALFRHKLALMFADERAIVTYAALHSAPTPAHALPRGAPAADAGLQEALPADHPLRRNPKALNVLADLGYWVLSLLEVGGALLLLAWSLRPRRPCDRAAMVVLLGGAACLVLTAALFLGDPRFRWPAMDLLIPAVGLCVAMSPIFPLPASRISRSAPPSGSPASPPARSPRPRRALPG